MVIYNESGALTTWQSAFFSWSMWVRVVTKAFWKHLWETPSQTCISFCGTAVLAWCEPSLELCLRSVNSKDNGAQSCLAPLQYSNWCVSIVFSKLHKGFLHSCHLQSRRMSHVFLYKLHPPPHPIPWCCVAATMCASTRKLMLRSSDHVCKCKERYHPHPTPPHPIPWCCVAPTMCASTRKLMLRSSDHVCKCKERYHPPPHPTPPHPIPWCCVAATMCASTRKMICVAPTMCKERYHPPPHPTPPHPIPPHPTLTPPDHVDPLGNLPSLGYIDMVSNGNRHSLVECYTHFGFKLEPQGPEGEVKFADALVPSSERLEFCSRIAVCEGKMTVTYPKPSKFLQSLRVSFDTKTEIETAAVTKCVSLMQGAVQCPFLYEMAKAVMRYWSDVSDNLDYGGAESEFSPGLVNRHSFGMSELIEADEKCGSLQSLVHWLDNKHMEYKIMYPDVMRAVSESLEAETGISVDQQEVMKLMIVGLQGAGWPWFAASLMLCAEPKWLSPGEDCKSISPGGGRYPPGQLPARPALG